MEHTIGKIPLLAASISLGLMLGTAATKPALAGSFDKNIVDNSNNQTIGHLKFDWNDANVTNNSINSFSDLTSFNYTDAQGKSFDLGFASGATFKNFVYNLSSGAFSAIAYNTAQERNGFYASPAKVAKDLSVMPPMFVSNFSLVNPSVALPPPPPAPPVVPPTPPTTPPIGSNGPTTPPPVAPPVVPPTPPTTPRVVPPTAPPLLPPPPSSSNSPETSAAEAIPEPSSVVGLLVIAGLGLGMSRKKLAK